MWQKIITSGSNAHLNEVTASKFIGDGNAIYNINSSSYAATASYTESLKSFGCGILGGTRYIETGYYNSKRIESNGTIVSYRIDSIDNSGNGVSGSIVFTLFKNNNFMGSASLSNSNTTFNTTLVGWERTLQFDDKIDFYVINNDVITNTILTVNYIQKT